MFCSLLLVIAFLFESKVLYNAYQKRLRLNEYNQMINEMTHSLQVIEMVFNKTDNLMKILKKSMKKKTKNVIVPTQDKLV